MKCLALLCNKSVTHKITSQQTSKMLTIHEHWPPQIRRISQEGSHWFLWKVNENVFLWKYPSVLEDLVKVNEVMMPTNNTWQPRYQYYRSVWGHKHRHTNGSSGVSSAAWPTTKATIFFENIHEILLIHNLPAQIYILLI